MSLNSLVLYPSDPQTTFNDRTALIDICHHIGLIGESFDYYGDLHFRPGDNFLRLIDFIRSHTVVKLAPSDAGLAETGRMDSRFNCHLEIPEFKQEPKFWIGATERVPQCPHCAFHIDNFPEVLDRWFANKSGFSWECPICRSSFQLHQLDWRHIAGLARFTIAIEGVHYAEAIPSSELLQVLAQSTATDWNYFYYHI